jgi:hypothetical protein
MVIIKPYIVLEVVLWLLPIYLWLYCMYIYCSTLVNLHLCMIIIEIIYFIMLRLLVLCLNCYCLLWWYIHVASSAIAIPSSSVLVYWKLFSFYNLEGIWRVIIIGAMILGCLIFPRIIFYGLTISSLDFLLYFSGFPILDLLFLFSMALGNPLVAPHLLFETCCNSLVFFTSFLFLLFFSL